MARRPQVVVLGGPNGAGKSSLAQELLPDLGIDVFANADIIAAGLNAADPQSVAIEAGRIMLTRVAELISARTDFAIETTLSGRSMQRLFAELLAAGYDLELHFIWLPGPEASLERVRRRVELGGHNIPEADVRRRFLRSVGNFYSIYRPLASRWFALNGAAPTADRDVAKGHGATVGFVYDSAIWSTIQQQAGEKPMSADSPKRVREAFVADDRRRAAIARADRAVILRHRAAGVPLVLWRDGAVVEVDPNTVELPEVHQLTEHAAQSS